MTLQDLLKVLPGYVTCLIHTKKDGWNGAAGCLAAIEEYQQYEVETVTPIAPYTVEISVKEVDER